MKIRTGFVSNSSSSSFIVEIREWAFMKSGYKKGDPPYIKIVDAETRKKLRKYGFIFTDDRLRDLDTNNVAKKSKEPRQATFMGYHVTCNQEDTIQFLIKNKISFNANIHYGHRSMMYDGKTDELIYATNFGDILTMYGKELFLEEAGESENKKYVIGTGKQYLKGELRL